MELATRPLSTVPEFEQAAELVHRAFIAGYAQLLSADALIRASPEWFLAQWNRPEADRSSLLGGFLGEELVAVARVGSDPDRALTGHLFSLYVHPDFQGRGLGRAMLTTARQAWSGSSFREATLWVFRDNEPAKALYTSDHWAPTGVSRIQDDWQAVECQMLTKVAS
jgi:ribosomal protein S18 acetylase RimI-like enzyme